MHHLRFSDCSAVSRPSAPATAVPPSFPRPFPLQQTREQHEDHAQWLRARDAAGQQGRNRVHTHTKGSKQKDAGKWWRVDRADEI